MTIGPDPMTRTLLDVVAPRHQRPPAGHEVDETVEEVGGVVRAGRGLGVVLDAERRLLEQREPLDDVVVEADVGDAGRAEGRVERARPAARRRRSRGCAR